jgi:FAD/FMN-containing dehydrogenase
VFYPGQNIRKGDSLYDVERKVYNGKIDRHPAAIVKYHDVADVISCVNFGRESGILAIRSGGHNAGGLGLCDSGLVIDMSLMKDIRADLKSNTVRTQGEPEY